MSDMPSKLEQAPSEETMGRRGALGLVAAGVTGAVSIAGGGALFYSAVQDKVARKEELAKEQQAREHRKANRVFGGHAVQVDYKGDTYIFHEAVKNLSQSDMRNPEKLRAACEIDGMEEEHIVGRYLKHADGRREVVVFNEITEDQLREPHIVNFLKDLHGLLNSPNASAFVPFTVEESAQKNIR